VEHVLRQSSLFCRLALLWKHRTGTLDRLGGLLSNTGPSWNLKLQPWIEAMEIVQGVSLRLGDWKTAQVFLREPFLSKTLTPVRVRRAHQDRESSHPVAAVAQSLSFVFRKPAEQLVHRVAALSH
jgi:hypothetical protein